MTEKKELICIGCPKGCALTVTMESGRIKEISGNTCPKGEDYAEKEMLDPRRTVTSTVRVLHGNIPVVPVKTVEDIPKSKIFECMEALRQVEVEAPVYMGDIVQKNVADTGVDVMATRDVHAIEG